ncbi:L-arginine-binding protein /L-ornithine-binding protein [Limimonas halophila]|uniref:L-arginine-binding protein /L-ornithine-binding protein n=1 Tax=Limimonas halophila TaxID=1082479 RepID=A0A1G7RMD0_9PROT|nr:transporter substrate-binding domain-containing protein [Limimonas halophila]SDG11843.1 L-arginine-binding protein /L-ornithine-binding protein [Limimonas halophila]
MFVRVFAAVVGVSSLVTAVTAPAAAYENCPDTLTLGIEAQYPPFQHVDKNGNLKGFDVDIANALCNEMRANCSWKQQDWAGIIPGLKAKKYDAAVASMAATKERDEEVDFTNKYYTVTGRFVGPKDVEIEISKESLAGMTVGVQRATTQVRLARNRFGEAIDLKTYDTQKAVNLDLMSGRIDLMIADTLMIEQSFLNTERGRAFEFKGPKFDDPRYYGDGVAIAVREGADPLRRCFNKAIKGIRKDGTYDRISTKHFGRNIYDG